MQIALVLLALSTAVISVDAHMPGAKAPPAFELSPFVVLDDVTEEEITIEDVGNYHNERMIEFKRQHCWVCPLEEKRVKNPKWRGANSPLFPFPFLIKKYPRVAMQRIKWQQPRKFYAG